MFKTLKYKTWGGNLQNVSVKKIVLKFLGNSSENIWPQNYNEIVFDELKVLAEGWKMCK